MDEEKRIKKYLIDISESISHIEEFTEGVDSFFDYEKNLLVKRAVERELEIIGEAMRRILDINEDIGIQHSRRIVDLRNRVIHGYDKVDDAVIWGILKKHIPLLKSEVKELLEEEE
jgi:uncharacterized protein with HEPN domain